MNRNLGRVDEHEKKVDQSEILAFRHGYKPQLVVATVRKLETVVLNSISSLFSKPELVELPAFRHDNNKPQFNQITVYK